MKSTPPDRSRWLLPSLLPGVVLLAAAPAGAQTLRDGPRTDDEPELRMSVRRVAPFDRSLAREDLARPGGAPLHFEVDLESGEDRGRPVSVSVQARYRAPGGPWLPVPGNCSGAPFVDANPGPNPRDREIVVALHHEPGGMQELQILDLQGGQLIKRYGKHLPNRIEAIDLDDADNDGLMDIVTGLAESGTNGPLRIFRYSAGSDSFETEHIVASLPLQIEDVEIGDADNDGENEIVVALERLWCFEPEQVSRVLLFEYSGGAWVGPIEVSAPELLSAQDVAIGDVDNDGLNEIVALFANVEYTEPAGRQVRVYKETGGQWLREDITPLVTSGYTRAERLLIGDVDGMPGNEIFTAYWTGVTTFSGRLVMLKHEVSGWAETLLDATVGLVDALDVGDFDGDDQVDLMVGIGTHDDARVRHYERIGGTWHSDDVTEVLPTTVIWDVALDDPDNDLCSEILVANYSTLRVYERGSTLPTATHVFPRPMDSVQVADVDLDGSEPLTCELPPGGREVVQVSIDVPSSAPAGSTWELSFEAQALVPSGPDTTRTVRLSSAPIPIRIVR